MTRFLAELGQTPEVIKGLTDFYAGEGKDLLSAFRDLAAGRGEIVFSGMGSSYLAPEAIFPRLARLGISSRIVDAGEWLHYGVGEPCTHSLVVLTSQSGESAEVKALIEQGQARGCVAITNDLRSTLARGAALTLPLLAGEETSISTKTYAATIAVLHLLASSLGGEGRLLTALDELRSAAEVVGNADEAPIASAAECLASAPCIAFVGRGPAHVAAQQCALTFMEGARILARAFTGGAFNHGPAELLERGFRLVILQAGEHTQRLAKTLGERALRLGAEVVMVTDTSVSSLGGMRKLAVPRPSFSANDGALFPLLACRTHSLLLHEVAAARGHEAGIFRHGGKVTSCE